LGQAAQILREKGYLKTFVLEGGIGNYLMISSLLLSENFLNHSLLLFPKEQQLCRNKSVQL